jgi:hypothetical protein
MTGWSGRAVIAGAAFALSLGLAASAHAKCMPATERPLPRPATKNFVPVLVTCETSVDAMKVFADLGTKHPQVMATLALDVEQVNVGAKGSYYRALLGKPGAKKDAASTCTTLRATGYKWCRAMQY